MSDHKLSLEEVATAAQYLDGKPVDEVLGWAFGKFGDGLGMMTALG